MLVIEIQRVINALKIFWEEEKLVALNAEIPSAAAAWHERGMGFEVFTGDNDAMNTTVATKIGATAKSQQQQQQQHVHPVGDRTVKLSSSQLSSALACLPMLEALPLYSAVEAAMKRLSWEWGRYACTGVKENVSRRQSLIDTISTTHKLTLLVLMHAVSLERGGGVKSTPVSGSNTMTLNVSHLKGGIPDNIWNEFKDMSMRVGKPCGACGD